MPRPKGIPKTGGRRKGTPNKADVNMRAALKRFGFNVLEELLNLYPQLDVNGKLRVLTLLSEYTFARYKTLDSQEIDENEDKQKSLSASEIAQLIKDK